MQARIAWADIVKVLKRKKKKKKNQPRKLHPAKFSFRNEETIRLS